LLNWSAIFSQPLTHFTGDLGLFHLEKTPRSVKASTVKSSRIPSRTVFHPSRSTDFENKLWSSYMIMKLITSFYSRQYKEISKTIY
jgi:hypothetical protein